MPSEPRKKNKDSLNILIRYITTTALVALATVASRFLYPYTATHNLVIPYLLAVVLAAFRLGLFPVIMTALLSLFAFDIFIVPTNLTSSQFAQGYLPLFAGLLVVGCIISSLVLKTKEHANALYEREAETASLYRLSRELSAASDLPALYAAVVRNAETSIASQAAIFHANGQIMVPAASSEGMMFSEGELASIEWSFKQVRPSLSQAAPEPASARTSCIPLLQAGVCKGILAMRDPLPGSGSQRLVEGFIAQTASALQRFELAQEAEQARIMQTRLNFERALLNSISHDLRTPLASITGALSTMRDKIQQLPAEAIRQLLESASGEADRLNRFVGKLLQMTRIDAGAMHLKLEPYDLLELAGCALQALESIFDTRRIKVLLPEDLPMVMMDQVLMLQVLVNLLENSLKYSPPDSEILVSATLSSPWIVIEISDHGPGIPTADLERVFEKFYRIPIPEGSGGTGLGLSICKGIVEAHGGKIWAESRTDGGLRMFVTLSLDVK